MAKSSKDELRRLELEEQIADAIKRSTANLQSFADAQKKISENYKIIQKINLQIQAAEEEVVELKAKGLKETSNEIKLIRQRQSALKQDIKLIIDTNKQLSTTKNLVKSIGGNLNDWRKNLQSQFIPSLSDVFNTFLKLNDLAIQTSVNVGLSGEGMALMKNNIQGSQMAWAELGFDLESSAKIQQSLADETGRQVVLSQQAQEQAALTARALNMQADELGSLIGQMDQFGLGSELAMSSIMDMRVESEKMGVNSGKVIKKFQQNLGLMNKLNFKDGVEGMRKMAALSEKYKIEMNSVAAAADKAFHPEGAIEMAAQLQLLGGSLAGLGDPFQLMYKARNNPEKFMEDITQAAKMSATFDPKTKEFKVSALEMDRLRVASEATGISMEELVQTAKQGAKLDMFESMLSGRKLTPEQKEMLTGLMEVGKNGEIKINGTDIKDLDDNALKKMVAREDDLQKLAEQAMSSEKELTGIKNLIMGGVVRFFTENEALIKSFLSGTKELVSSLLKMFSPTGLLATVLGTYFGPKIVWPIVQGWIFGKRAAAAFNAGTTLGKQGSILKPTTDKKALLEQVKQMKSQNPGMGTKEALDKIRGSGMEGQSKQMDQLSQSTSKLGGVSSMSAPQILALSVAILAVGAAIGVAAFGLSYLVESFKGLTGEQILGALGGLVIVMGGMALMLWLLTTASLAASLPLLAVGAAFLMIGGGVAIASLGLSVLVDSFTKMFSVIGDNGASLFLAGLGFMAMAAGIGILTLSLIGLGAASFLALPGLLLLGSATSMLVGAAESLNAVGGSDGLTKAVEAINSVDTNKLEALKDLSMWMALLGATTTIKFDESLHIDGSIELAGEAGGKTNTDWIKDPIFVSKLKQLIAEQTAKDLNGGRA